MIGSVRFAGDWSPTLVFVIAIVAAVGVAWLYLRESRSLAAPYNYVLPSLRASAVALVILMLAGPVWHRKVTIGTLGKVIFAVDVSQSMSMTDTQSGDSAPTRLDRALRLLGDSQRASPPTSSPSETTPDSTQPNDGGWLDSLAKTHEIEIVSFDADQPTIIWSSSDEEQRDTRFELSPSGVRSDLSLPLKFAQSAFSSGQTDDTESDETDEPTQRAAVVLISDGRHNLGESPVDVAQQLKAAGIDVHSIGMGSEDEPRDLGIVRVERPESVAADAKLAGSVVLKHSHANGENVVLKIETASNGEVVWQQTIKTNSSGQQSVPFELDVESIVKKRAGDIPRGVLRSSIVMDLLATLQPLSGDTNSQNNSMPFRVAASTRDRKLLILDGSSRWEVRYIRNLFERDPAWTVDTLLYGPGTDTPRVRRGITSGKFPNTREAISAYDAIILGEIPFDQVEPNDTELLREFVTRGGGLVVIDGRYDRLAKLGSTSLAELIPVRHIGEHIVNIRSVRPTRMGMEHPMLNLWGDKTELEEFWDKLPAPSTAAGVEVREGAEVWADIVTTDDRNIPWLVTRLFGGGRVFYLSSDQTWRWRYKVADRFHARFWNQLLSAVMQPPYSASDDYVALGTDKIEYQAGDSANIRARLQGTGGEPIGDATVDAILVSENRIIATVPLSIDDPARGTYQGQTPPLSVGAFEVRIRASGFDARALQATTPIWVGTQDSAEFSKVSLDQNALVQIAGAGGGSYFHESAASDLLEQLKPLSSGTVFESDVVVWQTYYWFFAVVLLLATEWWLRKRAGLV